MWPFESSDEFEDVLERWDKKVEAPSAENRKKVRLRVYKNGFVENVLATSDPALPGLWFGGVVRYGAYLAVMGAHPLLGVLVFAVGVLGCSWLECLLHRFPFHLDPGDSDFLKTTLFLIHGYHHQFPNDPWRLVAPPLLSWPVALPLFSALPAARSRAWLRAHGRDGTRLLVLRLGALLHASRA